mmetsp:Transcript_241/g.596  ORF Transcript_241/g.596 Transcript_241/m.596 type:complete len:99 (+) Transcript_241:688-984(+)
MLRQFLAKKLDGTPLLICLFYEISLNLAEHWNIPVVSVDNAIDHMQPSIFLSETSCCDSGDTLLFWKRISQLSGNDIFEIVDGELRTQHSRPQNGPSY